ncbi:SusC/RagA family TonB-linked outer membrane protein [Flavobacterium rhamnosiphilum]|uniref:SusC/RagA family TonB-linked outer membrane protein n=1 Tax=Flavobacterium rhamnosiphilum TaxID=2541724 RepID=A0A4R5FBH1_9FLAO|nr:SusC/RagA family TonB-linked outer membrane protein [Flavobacterium rhamnosiphilum]TDE45976.1 SusC/RagA family TonB-linked outer membrane protein [Flavobacterium rhamnosiphilum]
MRKLLHQLLLVCLVAMYYQDVSAQEKKMVSGTVRDSDGVPVMAATIKERGTSNGVVSDENGTFKISVNPNAVLVISSIGMKSLEVKTDNSGIVNVQLQTSTNELEGVVVTALGVSKKSRALGYASSTIKADAIVKAGSSNFASALYGKAPGVRIATAPGGATSAVNITIRGVNSIRGRSQPLIVLDGIPIRDGEVKNNDYWNDQRIRGNGLLDINPEDIDNISILKGASAAALYGSEAVNGVVLITTKSGKGKKGLGVDFSSNYSVDEVAFLPRYQNVRGQGYQLNFANAGQDSAGFIYYDTDGDGTKETRGLIGTSLNFGPKFDGKPTMAWDGIIRPYEAQKGYASLYQKGINSNVNIAISQSSENASMRFSLTRQDNQGVSIGSQNTKNVANLNTTFKLGKKLTTDLLINYVNQKTHNRPYSNDRMINNFTGMMGRFDDGAWYLNKYKTSLGYRFVTGANTQSLTPSENIIRNGFRGDVADYVWRVKENNEDEYSNRVIASMTHNYQIVDNLKLRARLATDFTSMSTETRNSTEIPLAFGNSGYFGLNSAQYSILYGDILLTYTKKITPDLELSAMGGYTASKDKGTSISRGTNGGLSVENWFDLSASRNNPNSDSRRTSLVKDAFMGTLNANYKNYFFLEGTIRKDRTSTMNPNNNSFVYPSVNSSLVISDLFTLPSAVSYAKIRGSWGIVGNYPDMYEANVAYNQNTLGVQQNGGNPVLYTDTNFSKYGNDLIKTETKHEIEFGLEAKFLNGRLGLDVSYYNAQIRDQILDLTLAPTSGASAILGNVGTLRNKGIEIGITATAIKTANFTWESTLNFAKNKNVVEKLANGTTELLHTDFDGNAAQLRSTVGQPMGDFYTHPIAVNDKGEKVVTSDGLYKIDNDKMTKVGNAMPKVTGGFINSFTYKNVTLDVVTDFRFGGHVMPTGINWMISRGLTEESTKYMDKASGGLSYYMNGDQGVQTTAAAGPNGEVVYNDGMLMDAVNEDGSKNTNVISQAYYYFNTYNWGGPQYSSSRYELYVQKNSYIKLREVSLSYNLPSEVAKKLGATKLSVSAFGRNLLYFYRTIKDMDAEQTTAGSRWSQTLTNAGTNPSTRTLGLMIRASF